MQRVFAAGVFVSAWLFTTSALAFAPDASGVQQVQELRPPRQLALSVPGAFMMLSDDNSDGTMTFLGNHPLRVEEVSASSAQGGDPMALAVINYFKESTHTASLELQQVSMSTNGNATLLAFAQTVNGVPVVGTYALAQITSEQVRYARQLLVQPPALNTVPSITGETASHLAQRDALSFARTASPTLMPTLAILYSDSQPYLVWEVQVSTEQPYGTWTQFIDAHSGILRTRRKNSLDAVEGTVTAPVEPSCQGDAPQMMAMPYVQWSRGSATGGKGTFHSQANPRNAEVSLNGAFFRIISAPGDNLTMTAPLHAAPADNELALDNAPLSQTDPYYYASQARTWVRARAVTVPELTNSKIWNWTQTQFPIKVNLPSGYQGFSCNAFYDGQALNFYQADARMGCNNSGRAAKIVFHEYGHGIHDHLTASANTFNHQMSEGVADYVMATMTGDPNVTGLIGCSATLRGRNTMRTCVNQYTFCNSKKNCQSFPGDEPHNSAPVMCGALWELRDAMQARYGADAGVLKADQFFLRFLTVATDMGSAYSAAIAADEDNDNDPSNGTVHSCEINKAFIGAGGDFAHFPDQVGQRVPCVR